MRASDGCTCVRVLNISGHGGQGSLVFGGDDEGGGGDFILPQDLEEILAGEELNKSEQQIKDDLEKLKMHLCEGATIRFVICKAGQGANGELLRQYLQQLLGTDKEIVLYNCNVAWKRGNVTTDVGGKVKPGKPGEKEGDNLGRVGDNEDDCECEDAG